MLFERGHSKRWRLRVWQCDGAIIARTRTRSIMETPVKQTPAASSEIVKLVRKLRWVGLEGKAEQLEKELEQVPATDTVLAVQSETD